MIDFEMHSWQEAWKKALIHPSVETFESLANDPDVVSYRPYQWLFISTLIATIASNLFGEPMSLVGTPCATLGTVLWIAIYIRIINWIARLLGGKGTYNQLIFATAAFFAPLSMISGVVELTVNLTPFLEYVPSLLGLYAFMLTVIAVKAIHQFSWLKAMIATLLLPTVFVGIIGVVLMAIFGGV